MTSAQNISCMLASSLMLGACPAAAEPIRPNEQPTIRAAIIEASQRFAIPTNWIGAVITVESGGNVHAVSPKGAMGLMQIMPATWSPLHQRYHLGDDPYDVHDNIFAGTALLRELYDRFGPSGFLTAYNAGPSRYIAFLTTGEPLGGETQAYLTKLAPLLGGRFSKAILAPVAVQDWRSAPLFLSVRSASSISAPTEPLPSSPATAAVLPSRLAPGNAGIFALLAMKVSSP